MKRSRDLDQAPPGQAGEVMIPIHECRTCGHVISDATKTEWYRENSRQIELDETRMRAERLEREQMEAWDKSVLVSEDEQSEAWTHDRSFGFTLWRWRFTISVAGA